MQFLKTDKNVIFLFAKLFNLVLKKKKKLAYWILIVACLPDEPISLYILCKIFIILLQFVEWIKGN